MMRYRLDLPVTFRWRDQQGHDQVGAGFTHDVSAVGMFVFTDHIPPQCEFLRCEVKLPRLRDSGCVPFTVSGRVVRVCLGTDRRQRGFAVVGEMLQLCSELSADEGEESEMKPSAVPAPSKLLN